ncbi:MAG: hypothetical protein ACO1RX_06795 [Candidatus Sericytochromatia bacterium]
MNQTTTHAAGQFDPAAGFQIPEIDTLAAVLPADAPPHLTEDFNSLKQRLNANPRVEYIEIDRRDLNTGLSAFLTQFRDQLAQNPALREQLAQTGVGRDLLETLENAAKGRLSTDDVIKLQTFLVAGGADISHKHSPSGIDGDYGPRTHAGLQRVFAQLLQSPATVTERVSDPQSESVQRATAGARERREALAESEDDYRPSSSRSYDTPTASGVPGFQPPASSGPLGDQIADAARRVVPGLRNPKTGRVPSIGYCMYGVRRTMDSIENSTGIRLRQPNGANIVSAKDADAAITRQFSDRFERVEINPNDYNQLRNLPAGAIVVWGANPDRSTWERGGGWKHGHISIALGNGMEASDHIQAQITNRNGKYGSCVVFLPRN